MRYYIISENELSNLIANNLELRMLNCDGVDNWTWYGESRNQIIRETMKDIGQPLTEEDDIYGIDFDYIADTIIESGKYKEYNGD